MPVDTPPMKLYHAGPSPFARKTRIVALELGLMPRIEPVEIKVAPGMENASYAGQVNPLRRVPAMRLENGTTLADSGLICQYLDELAGHRLIPADGDRRWRVLEANAIATGMTEAAVQLRYETFLRPDAQRWSVWSDDLVDKIRSALDWFEARAGDGSVEPELDLGVIALGCALDYLDFRHPDIGWRDAHPRLVTLQSQLAAREAFRATAPEG